MLVNKVPLITTVAACLSLAAATRLPRQSSDGGVTDGPCGEGVASCAKGYCCSAAGYVFWSLLLLICP